MNKFILNEEEKLRILNLHESANKRHYLSEQEEKIVTNHDRTYDYKKSGEEYFYKLKNATDWTKASGKGLESIKTKVYKEGNTSKSDWSKYPCVVNFEGAQKKESKDFGMYYVINSDWFFSNGRRTKDGKMANYSCEDDMFVAKTDFPFTTNEEGNKFRAWMNKYYPKTSKSLQLDAKSTRSDGFNNSYMKKAWNTSLEKSVSTKFGVSTYGDLYNKQVLKSSNIGKEVEVPIVGKVTGKKGKKNDAGYYLSKNQEAVGKIAYVKGDFVNFRVSPKVDDGGFNRNKGKTVKGKNKEIGKVKSVVYDTGGNSKKWYQIDGEYVREDVVTLK